MSDGNAEIRPLGGLYEHWFGTSDLEFSLRYWQQLGFTELARGRLAAEQAEALYGHRSALTSVRLRHRGQDRQGLIRVLHWERAAGPGLEFAHALTYGSRWSGFYTRDLVQIQDAYRDEAALTGAEWRVSALARLFVSDAKPGFFQPFVGIRESTIVGREHRQAFLQRVGFDRPGFGTFAADTPLPVTESTHGNVVLRQFERHTFYADAFGLTVQTPPHQIDWTYEAVRHSLGLNEGEAFSVVVYQTPGEPSGFLRVYGPREPREDLRERSRPGQLGNCGHAYRYDARLLPAMRERLVAHGATDVTPVLANEFGEASVSCRGPDGYSWNLLATS